MLQFPPDGFTDAAANCKYAASTDVGGLDDSAKALAKIGRDAMAIVKVILGHCELFFRIKDNQIGIVSFGDAAFA